MKKVPITLAGIERLRKELHELKTVRRPHIIQAIAEARAHGDLRENAEYHAAKEQQGFIEGRIAELDQKLACAEVIDVKKIAAQDRIVFGATVELINEDSGDEVRYQIVGVDEADIKARRISIDSPIARALIGKEVGDTATVKAPGGDIVYEIVAVRYV